MLRDEQGKALLLELPEGLRKLPRPGRVEVGRRLITHKGRWLHGIYGRNGRPLLFSA